MVDQALPLDGLARNDFAVEMAGCFHLRTWRDLAVFAAHCALMVALAFALAAVLTL
jgi:hypothetical protein